MGQLPVDYLVDPARAGARSPPATVDDVVAVAVVVDYRHTCKDSLDTDSDTDCCSDCDTDCSKPAPVALPGVLCSPALQCTVCCDVANGPDRRPLHSSNPKPCFWKNVLHFLICMSKSFWWRTPYLTLECVYQFFLYSFMRPFVACLIWMHWRVFYNLPILTSFIISILSIYVQFVFVFHFTWTFGDEKISWRIRRLKVVGKSWKLPI